MSADRTPAPGAAPQVASILGQHRYREVLGDYEVEPFYRHFGCSCGWEQNIAGMSGYWSWREAHDVHVAEQFAPRPEPVVAPSIDDLIEASSLGTPEAKAARESVDPEDARRIVERANELSEPVVAPLPTEAVEALAEVLRLAFLPAFDDVPMARPLNQRLDEAAHYVLSRGYRLVPEDDEDTVRVPCGCWSCASKRPGPFGLPETNSRMIVCPDCGNKRCPRATRHDLACTGSNEPNQPGSRFEFADTDERTNS